MAQPQAFGSPGIAPRWTNGAKEGVGTSYAASSRVWFTLWRGIITEVYYPTVDAPQIRDLQLLFTDGETFFHEEKRDFEIETSSIDHSLGYEVTAHAHDAPYSVHKEIITEPHLPTVLMRVRVKGEPELLEKLQIFALCAPHIDAGGWQNTGESRPLSGKRILTAHLDSDRGDSARGGTWLALGASPSFNRTSVGYVGASDGWTDLSTNFALDWEFACAGPGNIALTGELCPPLKDGVREFVLALSFGDGRHSAETSLLQSLGVPFDDQKAKFLEQWQRPHRRLEALEEHSCDGGTLYKTSFNVLLAHEDKRYPGALIASLSIPWGEIKGPEEIGGYHLVWPRDMVNSATALMAVGQHETAFRALMYLAASQYADGSFAQNFWLDGRPHFSSLQLDEVAYPLLLARALDRGSYLRAFDPMPLVSRAAAFLVDYGPVTPQERWEEAAGLSPSTLAVVIAGQIAAAQMLRERGDENSAALLESYADWLEANLESWCVTRSGCLVEDEKEHYVRIFPLSPGQKLPSSPPGDEEFAITSRPPGERVHFQAREIVDGGFLELVRYGIRDAGDPLIEASVRVMDHVLRVETPRGVCFLRYNFDSYGQNADGAPYKGTGVGHGWPLLGGERGHYEIAAGRDPSLYIASLEGFANGTGMITEQVWNAPDIPEQHMFKGQPTGAAMPLAWAHGEYVKLLRSRRDGAPYDRLEAAHERYVKDRSLRHTGLTFWNKHYPSERIAAGTTLRLVARQPFRARWTTNGWSTHRDTESRSTRIGLYYADLPAENTGRLEWTFFWPQKPDWDGSNYGVNVD